MIKAVDPGPGLAELVPNSRLSCAGRGQAQNFVRSGYAPGLLVRENRLAVDFDVEHAKSAHAKFDLHAGVLFQFLFQAHGLMAGVRSKNAALDLDVHRSAIIAVATDGLQLECGHRLQPWRRPRARSRRGSRPYG